MKLTGKPVPVTSMIDPVSMVKFWMVTSPISKLTVWPVLIKASSLTESGKAPLQPVQMAGSLQFPDWVVSQKKVPACDAVLTPQAIKIVRINRMVVSRKEKPRFYQIMQCSIMPLKQINQHFVKIILM